MTRQRFSDGCHRYGWLIALITTVIMQIIVAAYLAGSQTQKLQDVKEGVQEMKKDVNQRIDRLENLMLSNRP